jgi:uncharacterized protein YkwD
MDFAGRRVRTAVAAAAVAAGLVAVPAQADAACAHAGANPNDISVRQAKTATLCLLNKQRRGHGMRRLRENRRLSRASQRHARAMARRRFFEHGDFIGRIRASHYLRGTRGWTVGENIAWGSEQLATPRSIVRSWMHSPGHRANILNRRFREIGIGLTRGAPESGFERAATYATDFGARF